MTSSQFHDEKYLLNEENDYPPKNRDLARDMARATETSFAMKLPRMTMEQR